MRNFLSTLFFSLIVGGVWGQVTLSLISQPSLSTNDVTYKTLNSPVNSGSTSYPECGYLISYVSGAQITLTTSGTGTSTTHSSTYPSNLFVSPTPFSNTSNLNNTVTTTLSAGHMFFIRTYIVKRVIAGFGPSATATYTILYSPEAIVKTYPTEINAPQTASACLNQVLLGTVFTAGMESGTSSYQNTTYAKSYYVNNVFYSSSNNDYLVDGNVKCEIVATYPDNTTLTREKIVSASVPTPITLNVFQTNRFIVNSNQTEFTFTYNGSIADFVYWSVQNSPELFNLDYFYDGDYPSSNSVVLNPISTTYGDPNLQITPNSTVYFGLFIQKTACNLEDTYSAPIEVFRLPTPSLNINQVEYNNQVISNCPNSPNIASIDDISRPIDVNIDNKIYNWAFFSSTAATVPVTSFSPGNYIVRYAYVENNVTYYSDTYTTITFLAGSVYTGPTGTAQTPITQAQFDNVNNWCPASTPTNPIINTTVYLDGSYNYTNLTIECGGSLIITETGRVNITNVLTNGGLVQVINGGTIKYGTTVAQIGTCNGTYEYKESFPASSRFWYLGSTITNATRESFGVVGSSSTGTQMWDWTEATQGYTLMGTANTPLTVGRGYVWKNNSGSTMNVTLTGTYNSAPVTISSLTRQGTGSFAGFHLISNPYTSYLDIHQVLGGINTSPTNLFTNSGTQNMWRDAWVRSINSGGTMIFDAYNATSGIGTGTSTVALSSGLTPTSVGRWIAPMQGVWVRVKPGMTGSIYMDNTMTNPNPAGAGQLRSASAVEGLARINVVYGNQIDQMVAALSPNASNAQDAYDTEKMFITNYVQVYAPNTGKKFAINTLKNSKSKVSMPITIECPGSGWYSINLAELELPNGVLFLEDKLNGEMKDLTIDSSYQFFANSGVLATRFVLHFHLPTIVANPAGPSSMDDLVSESQNAVIDIRANGSGKVNVSLDMVDEVTNSFVRICDMNGRILESFQIDGSSFEFQMNHGQGIYLVEVSNGLTVEKKKVFVQ